MNIKTHDHREFSMKIIKNIFHLIDKPRYYTNQNSTSASYIAAAGIKKKKKQGKAKKKPGARIIGTNRGARCYGLGGNIVCTRASTRCRWRRLCRGTPACSAASTPLTLPVLDPHFRTLISSPLHIPKSNNLHVSSYYHPFPSLSLSIKLCLDVVMRFLREDMMKEKEECKLDYVYI